MRKSIVLLQLIMASWSMAEMPPDKVGAYLATLSGYQQIQAKVSCDRLSTWTSWCIVFVPQPDTIPAEIIKEKK